MEKTEICLWYFSGQMKNHRQVGGDFFESRDASYSFRQRKRAWNANCVQTQSVVEAGGIEPPSENTSTQVSPSAVCLLGFPSRTAGKQAMRYGIL